MPTVNSGGRFFWGSAFGLSPGVAIEPGDDLGRAGLAYLRGV
jgi:hypothetical protein